MLTTMIQTVRLFALLSGAPSATVDTVEDGNVARVCTVDCVDVQTVSARKGGVVEGQAIGGTVCSTPVYHAPMGSDIKL